MSAAALISLKLSLLTLTLKNLEEILWVSVPSIPKKRRLLPYPRKSRYFTVLAARTGATYLALSCRWKIAVFLMLCACWLRNQG